MTPPSQLLNHPGHDQRSHGRSKGGEFGAGAAQGEAAIAAAPASLITGAGLSRAQKKTLREYQDQGAHDRINNALREGRGGKVRQVAQIDDAMADSPLSSDVLAFRGAPGGEMFGPRESWPDDLTGREWDNPAFMSTSTRPDVADSFGYSTGLESHVMLRMVVPKGTRAIALSGHGDPNGSRGDGNEGELLLQRGLRLRVVGDSLEYRGRDEGIVPRRERDPDEYPIPTRVLDVEFVPATPQNLVSITPRFAAYTVMSRERVLNHPGHGDQKSHGRKGGGDSNSERIEGRDLSASLDYDAIDAGDHSIPGSDVRLARIQQEQGFDGPARQVDDAEWQRLADEGGTVMYRGVRGRKDGPDAEEIAAGYAEGDLLPARGSFGSGTYFVGLRETADAYASGDASGQAVFEGGEAFRGGATLEAMLLPDARVLDWHESGRLRQDVGGMDEYQAPATARERVLADEGRMAATLGYDAVRVSLNEPSYGDELIILNRTATAVRASKSDE